MSERPWELGVVLKEIRIRRSMSLTVAAQKSGISRSAIIRIEAGDRTPGLATLSGLADALDIRFIVDADGVFVEDAPQSR